MAPFVAIFLAFSVGERAVAHGGAGFVPASARRESEPTRSPRVACAQRLGARRRARRSCRSAGLVLALAGRATSSAAGTTRSAWPHQLDQLGGASKAVEVSGAFAGLLLDQWYIVAVAVRVAAACSVLRPGVGQVAAAAHAPGPVADGHDELAARGRRGHRVRPGGAVPVPVRPGRAQGGRRAAARSGSGLPALLVGAMTAYTSADGFVHSAVGLLPGVVASGALPGLGPRAAAAGSRRSVARSRRARRRRAGDARRSSCSSSIGGAGWRDLSARMASGPWQGIAVTPAQRAPVSTASRRTWRRRRGPETSSSSIREGAAYYLYWPGRSRRTRTSCTWPTPAAPLPKATVSYYRRHREVPTLVVHLTETAGQVVGRPRRRLRGP